MAICTIKWLQMSFQMLSGVMILLDNYKIVNLKMENRDRKKYLNKAKIVEPWYSILCKIPILTGYE